MGYFTEVGIGASANLEDAKRWYWRAAGKLEAELSILMIPRYELC
jgi:TPR repeat protein